MNESYQCDFLRFLFLLFQVIVCVMHQFLFCRHFCIHRLYTPPSLIGWNYLSMFFVFETASFLAAATLSISVSLYKKCYGHYISIINTILLSCWLKVTKGTYAGQTSTIELWTTQIQSRWWVSHYYTESANNDESSIQITSTSKSPKP